MHIDMKNRPVLRDLGNGLLLCRTRAGDGDAVGEFNGRIHSDFGFDQPDLRVAAWTRDLIDRPHPSFHPDDCTLLVEASSGKIVSSVNLISQTWAYEGIPFGVGRPELVGTLPEYRNRGLVRVQFDEVHRWSAERGELVQGITGIPYYYRLFGYEMGLELSGGRIGYEAQLPKLKEGEGEPVVVRAATEADIPFLMEVYAHACTRRLIACVRDEALWRYELSGQSPQNCERHEIRILQRPDGETLGYLTHPWYGWKSGLNCHQYELKPGVSWLETTPGVMRYLWATGGSYAQQDNQAQPRTSFGMWFGSQHPCYDLFRNALPDRRDPYAWYIRVPDLPEFLRRIAPALERHVAESDIVGHSGELKLSFYRSGLRLVLERGRLTTIEAWQPTPADGGQAAFPDLSFLQLVFGYRSFDALEQSYADCWCTSDEARAVLGILFPQKASSVAMVN